MKTKLLFAALLLAVFALAVAYGDIWAIKGNIPFQFTAAGKVLPAGDYTLVPDLDNQLVRVEPSKGTGVALPVITRIAAGVHSTATDAHAVFDKVGNTYFLSEIWLPNEDGFLVHVTKGPHQHHVLHLPRR